VRTFHLEPEFFVQGDTDGVSKHENAADSLPCSYRRRKRRAAGVGESLASAEDTFAHWRGYTVTYPTKYKRSRAAFPGSALQETHATIRSSEGLRIGHRPRHRFIRNAEADTQNYSVCMRWDASLFCHAKCCGWSEGIKATWCRSRVTGI
jgi:hypothetical protein